VYWASRNILDFKVVTDHYIPQGTAVVIDADWSVQPGAAVSDREEEDLSLALFGPEDAEITDRDRGLTVQTSRSNFTYAMKTANLMRSDIKIAPRTIVIDGWLDEGGVSVGLLDAERNEFVASGLLLRPGSFRYTLSLDYFPETYSIIFSNHQLNEPGVSRFTVRRVRFAAAERLVYSGPATVDGAALG
jgi:hypothetical protein